MIAPTFEMQFTIVNLPISLVTAFLGFGLTSNAKRLNNRVLGAVVWCIGAVIIAFTLLNFGTGTALSLEAFVKAENLLLLPAYLLEAYLVYRVFFRKRVAPYGLCTQCGYDLRASPERCPECGLAVSTPMPSCPTATNPVSSNDAPTNT